MAQGFFVTGIGTGVGKTVVSVAIIMALRSMKFKVCGMKPVETGCKAVGKVLEPADGRFLLRASGVNEDIDEIVPYMFTTAVSPMVASDMERKEIDVLWIGRIFERLSQKYDAVVVEGAGGILVPIDRDHSIADLAQEMNLPIVIVAAPYIGSINHTLLTVDFVLRAGLRVAGIVINHNEKTTKKNSLACDTTARAIEELSPLPIIGKMPYLKDLSLKALGKAAKEHLDYDILSKFMTGT